MTEPVDLDALQAAAIEAKEDIASRVTLSQQFEAAVERDNAQHRYIDAVRDPSTVLALIGELRDARAEVARLSNLYVTDRQKMEAAIEEQQSRAIKWQDKYSACTADVGRRDELNATARAEVLLARAVIDATRPDPTISRSERWNRTVAALAAFDAATQSNPVE